jgi:predicted SAM-dependent methyltransferase
MNDDAERQASTSARAEDSHDRLHVGCGDSALPGWINVDIKELPGVDLVADVRQGVPFSGLHRIFAEHFIEHLEIFEAVAFLVNCQRALRPGGLLRLTTPNLDWVMQSHYAYGRWLSPDDAIRDCLQTNLAFHGWGHKFLYNFSMLKQLLALAGFEDVVQANYGESSHPDLRNLERHPPSPDWPGLPHVVAIEGAATGTPATGELPSHLEEYVRTCAVR